MPWPLVTPVRFFRICRPARPQNQHVVSSNTFRNEIAKPHFYLCNPRRLCYAVFALNTSVVLCGLW